MKKRLVTLIVAGTLIMSSLAGCGSASDTEKDATPQAQEETVVEDVETPEETIIEETSIEVEESAVEEETVVEIETVEETEVVKAEAMTFDRENYTLKACVTNFNEDYVNPKHDYRLIANDFTYSVNDYMDIEIMTELANRGYDISDFTVSWMVAVNESGTWSNGELTADFNGFADSDEEFVKLYPIFIKTNNIDSSKLVYNFNRNREDLTEYALTGTDADAMVWYAVHQGVADMKNDVNYEEIDFRIPDSYFKTKTETRLREYVASEDIVVKDLTLNDWYNGMIYAMFVSKTVDLDGLFDHDCTS